MLYVGLMRIFSYFEASMSVKEVVQSLVDDNLVDTDKIGTSIYFWAYPSKAMHTVSTHDKFKESGHVDHIIIEMFTAYKH